MVDMGTVPMGTQFLNMSEATEVESMTCPPFGSWRSCYADHGYIYFVKYMQGKCTLHHGFAICVVQ